MRAPTQNYLPFLFSPFAEERAKCSVAFCALPAIPLPACLPACPHSARTLLLVDCGAGVCSLRVEQNVTHLRHFPFPPNSHNLYPQIGFFYIASRHTTSCDVFFFCNGTLTTFMPDNSFQTLTFEHKAFLVFFSFCFLFLFSFFLSLSLFVVLSAFLEIEKQHHGRQNRKAFHTDRDPAAAAARDVL